MRIEQGAATEGNGGYAPLWRRVKGDKAPVAKADPEFAAEIIPTSARPLFSVTNRNYDDDTMYVSTTTDGANHYFSKIRQVKTL